MTLVEMPPRAPDAPDPFSFADPEHVTQILHQAGWSGIDICPYRTEVAVGGEWDCERQHCTHTNLDR